MADLLDDRMLTTREVASRLGFAIGTLENWRYIGKGPIWIRVGRSVRYPECNLKMWLANRGVRL